jgi:hypothetical protein
MAEREGFEPSMELLTPYSLSRGAPSATRPSLQCFSLRGRPSRWVRPPISASHPEVTDRAVIKFPKGVEIVQSYYSRNKKNFALHDKVI